MDGAGEPVLGGVLVHGSPLYGALFRIPERHNAETFILHDSGASLVDTNGSF